MPIKISNSFPILFLILSLFQFNSTAAQNIIFEIEAENGNISGATEIVDGCNNASGGGFVRLNSDSLNILLFDNITVSDSGTYRLVIDYFYLGAKPIQITVNDSVTKVYDFPAATWCFQGPAAQFAVDIYLQKGNNSILFEPYNNINAPFIDKIILSEIFKPSVSISATSLRILEGNELDIILNLNGISTNNERVELSFPGIPKNNFSVDDSILVIPAGQKTVKTRFRYTAGPAARDTFVPIVIKNTSEGIVADSIDSINIHIVTKPEVFYVSNEGSDENDGLSPQNPWKSIQKLNSYSFVPGDSILMKSGNVFNNQLKISISGNEHAPLYFGKYNGEIKPVINAAAAPGGAYIASVLINNSSHIILENLEIRNDRKMPREGQDDRLGYGVYLLNNKVGTMKNITLKNLHIEDIYAISTEGVDFNAVNVSGVSLHSTANTLEENIKQIRDVLIENCYITHTGKYGIRSRHEGAWGSIGDDTLNRNMNITIRNNYFYETGGAGIMLGRTYNALIENNSIERSGSNYDPRMVNRGSGAWFWKCINVLAQYNKILHSRGPMDSYSIHTDWGNRNTFVQYNYSEDIEGGFVEILGDNVNSVYRYNISINDGFRDYRGNSIWVSTYAGRDNEGVVNIPSDSNYIYNNTIYIDKAYSPGIEIRGLNTFLYNNIFYTSGVAKIGYDLDLWAYENARLEISNNLYSGDVNPLFTGFDEHPLFGDPLFVDPGKNNAESYKLAKGSIAIDSGISFSEPVFPMAGKGIFSHVKGKAEEDIFGNPVNLSIDSINIGAFNGKYKDSAVFRIDDFLSDNEISVFPNPATEYLNVEIISWIEQNLKLRLMDVNGRVIKTLKYHAISGKNIFSIPLSEIPGRDILYLVVEGNKHCFTRKIFIK